MNHFVHDVCCRTLRSHQRLRKALFQKEHENSDVGGLTQIFTTQEVEGFAVTALDEVVVELLRESFAVVCVPLGDGMGNGHEPL